MPQRQDAEWVRDATPRFALDVVRIAYPLRVLAAV